MIPQYAKNMSDERVRRSPAERSGPGGPPATLAGRTSRRRPRSGQGVHPLIAGVLAGLLVLGAGIAYTALRPTTYTATSVFSLVPRDPASTNADTVEMVGRAYMAYLSSPDLLGRIAQTSGGPREVLADATEITVEAGSANLQTKVTLPDEARAAQAANAVSEAGFVKARADVLVSPDLVSPAVVGAAEEHPPRLLLAAASLLAALLAGGLVGYVVSHRYGWYRGPTADHGGG